VSKKISDNRKARYDFYIEDKFEAGMELLGWEVKSARAGSVNLADSFVWFENGSAWLKNAHFSPYQFGDIREQDTRRDRRLLLNKSEINKLHTAVRAKGYTCVATKIYFNGRGIVKLEIATAKGKHTYDKKKTEKERDILRETKKEIG
jgi:SsrA-binding protein